MSKGNVKRNRSSGSLTHDLTGLMAIHHFEDIVVREQSAAKKAVQRKDAVVERPGEQYRQVMS